MLASITTNASEMLKVKNTSSANGGKGITIIASIAMRMTGAPSGMRVTGLRRATRLAGVIASHRANVRRQSNWASATGVYSFGATINSCGIGNAALGNGASSNPVRPAKRNA